MLNQTPRARTIVQAARAAGQAVLPWLVEGQIAGRLPRATLLAICPNSRAVVRAALRAAQRLDAPLLFAATLNQVDRDGGYTGWTPRAFVDFVDAEAQVLGLDVPLLPGLDHGGPWLKDAHTRDALALEATTAEVKRSLDACLDAGYALLHLDATLDRRLPPGTPPAIDGVVARTLDLLAHAEAYRTRRGLPLVGYEVGTEEVAGGLADVAAFDAFLRGLDAGLRARGLAHARPCFVVGKVGTDLHTTTFDAPAARALTASTVPYGALVKGHYTDGVDHPEDYPLAGMGGANVGPALADVEFAALRHLVGLERKLGTTSGFVRVLTEAVEASGRWRKWLQPGEDGRSLAALDPARRAWLVGTGSRYVWTDPAVEEARAALYAHVAPAIDADAYVLWRIETAILRYGYAFNLAGLMDELARA